MTATPSTLTLMYCLRGNDDASRKVSASKLHVCCYYCVSVLFLIHFCPHYFSDITVCVSDDGDVSTKITALSNASNAMGESVLSFRKKSQYLVTRNGFVSFLKHAAFDYSAPNSFDFRPSTAAPRKKVTRIAFSRLNF